MVALIPKMNISFVIALAVAAWITPSGGTTPLVVVIAMPAETETEWFKKTIDSLIQHKYDYIIMPATPKSSPIRGGNASEAIAAMGLRIRHWNDGQLGVWVSHLRAWSMLHMLGRPIISLEADTRAILPWGSIKHTDWKEYDILFTHDHQHRKRRCGNLLRHFSSIFRQSTIREGLDSRFAAGAMLFTGRTPLRDVVRMIDTNLPIDHWFNFIDSSLRKRDDLNQNTLKIATLCPSLFYQRVDKPSLIQK